MSNKVIEVNDLSFGYHEELVLQNLNLTVNKGELVSIIGGNGTGKSTLMKLILGELTPVSGTIRLLDQDPIKMTDFQKVGYVPQGNLANKIGFPITCLELVVQELYNDFGFFKFPKKPQLEKAKQMLTKMGLEEHINRPFKDLSGGLQQRVMISRALINEPELIIMDEPTAGVDAKSKEHFARIISDLVKDGDITILMITHELAWTNEYLDIDETYELKEGGLTHVSI